jgi:formate-dependent nitrite reductase cytochrome c552 subunit
VHWYGSVHGKKGVTCDKCHGGDPGQVSKKKAHAGVGSVKDAQSPVYYKNLPETCGTCHRGVYEQFVQSRHYQNLKADRLAPTCTTCHGFQMDIGGVEPLQVAGRCTICHNPQKGVKPEVADLTRQIMDEITRTEQAIQKAQLAVDLAGEQGVEPKEASQMLRSARDRLKKTGDLWHRFHLTNFKQELMEIQATAGQAYRTARQAVKGR